MIGQTNWNNIACYSMNDRVISIGHLKTSAISLARSYGMRLLLAVQRVVAPFTKAHASKFSVHWLINYANKPQMREDVPRPQGSLKVTNTRRIVRLSLRELFRQTTKKMIHLRWSPGHLHTWLIRSIKEQAKKKNFPFVSSSTDVGRYLATRRLTQRRSSLESAHYYDSSHLSSLNDDDVHDAWTISQCRARPSTLFVSKLCVVCLNM